MIRRANGVRRSPSFGGSEGWRDVVRRADGLRRRRRRQALLVAALAATATLTTSFGASGGFRGLIHHSTDSPLTTLAGGLRGETGRPVGSFELELPGTVSRLPFRPRGAARLVPPRLRPFRVVRTAAGPTSTTDSFNARWFLELEDDRAGVGSVLLTARDGDPRGKPIRLCGPCLPRDSGRISLTLAQATALVNERLGVVVRTASGSYLAAAPIERVETPVFWPGERGLIGGRLEIRRPAKHE